MIWDYQYTVFRNDCTEQFSINYNCIHFEKKDIIDWFEDLIWYISEHFINSEILKIQIVTLLYSFFFAAQNYTLNSDWIDNYF